MSVVAVWESHDGREGDQETDSATLRRVFWVRTNNPKDGSLTAINAPGVPPLYTPYFDGLTVHLGYVVKNRRATNHSDSQMLWKVEIEYEQKNDEEDDENNPLNKPATYDWSDFSTSVEMIVDTATNKVENTAHQPFDPGIETLKSTDVLTITRNEQSYNAWRMEDFKNTLNATPIFGWAAREGRIDSISAKSEYDAEYGAYWTVTYVIHFRITTRWVPTIPANRLINQTSIGPWDEVRRNVGTRYKLASGSTKTDAAVGNNGLQESDPVDLKDDNTRLPLADLGSPYYCVFLPFYDFSWSPLRLEP